MKLVAKLDAVPAAAVSVTEMEQLLDELWDVQARLETQFRRVRALHTTCRQLLQYPALEPTSDQRREIASELRALSANTEQLRESHQQMLQFGSRSPTAPPESRARPFGDKHTVETVLAVVNKTRL
jgi:hypothetical protein